MTEVYLTLVLILIAFLLHKFWIKPRKAIKFYGDQLKAMKYKSLVLPYRFFYNRFLAPFFQGRKVGDPAIYYKTQFPKYEIVVSNVMNTPYIQFGHPDFLKDFYSMDKHYQFTKLPLFVQPFVNTLGYGVLWSEGNLWKKKRNLLNKLFNFDFVKMQVPNIVNICDRCIAQMEEKSTKGQNEFGKYVQCNLFHDLLVNIFSSVIFTGFIGLKEKYDIDGIQASQYILKLIDDIGQYRIISPTVVLGDWFYKMQVRKIDKSINQRSKKVKEWGNRILETQLEKVEAEIKNKGKQCKIDNILKSYVSYKKENNTQEDILSNKDIFAEFMVFIFAGTDTTSNFVNAMLCYIAKYPEAEKQLRKQIDQFMRGDDYSYENLKNFKYIEAVQKETTRIYGPANLLFLRQATEDNFLNGLAIKKGTLVSVNCFANHYSEKHFKDPMEFRPQRWLNGQCSNLDPFVLLGFGGGARTCIGKHLALLESKIALIKIMKRYKKIRLGKQNFKWQKKFFTMPEYFKTKLTINQ